MELQHYQVGRSSLLGAGPCCFGVLLCPRGSLSCSSAMPQGPWRMTGVVRGAGDAAETVCGLPACSDLCLLEARKTVVVGVGNGGARARTQTQAKSVSSEFEL